MRRIPCNFPTGQLALARALYPKDYLETIKSVDIGASDQIVLGYLRAISVSLASQDFEEVYDEMLRDERLSDGERDVIATATLEMERRLLALL